MMLLLDNVGNRDGQIEIYGGTSYIACRGHLPTPLVWAASLLRRPSIQQETGSGQLVSNSVRRNQTRAILTSAERLALTEVWVRDGAVAQLWQ
jgi:hypothetical protein